MRHLALCTAVLGIACATSAPVVARATPATAPESVASAPTTKTAVEAAAEFALTHYVDESTRTHGVVCVELDRAQDRAAVLDRLTPLAGRLSADRTDCRSEPSAILSIGPPQVAGDQARVDVGVVLGSAGMLELERRQGDWQVVRVTSPWISLR
jgi:hypothetical protein